MRRWFRSGTPWVWLTSGAVSISLIAVIGLLGLIAWQGLSYFWPSAVHQFEVKNSQGAIERVIGEIYQRDDQAGANDNKSAILIKTGNREFVDLDFRWLEQENIVNQHQPQQVVVLERYKNGNFYGVIERIETENQQLTAPLDQLQPKLASLVDRAQDLNQQAIELQEGPIASINYRLEKLRLKQRRLALDQALTPIMSQTIEEQRQALKDSSLEFESQLFKFREQAYRDKVWVRDMRKQLVSIPLAEIVKFHFPNQMTLLDKVSHWLSGIGHFVSEQPREANTEGGVFPAIFGTVFMVLLMAVIVTPFGVVAAIYLHEYAKKSVFTKLIRIAVINLAGVPSVVYGVFGLGFFVYILGGNIDQLFYPESSPAPVFGSPGVLWSALTLAILTLPVVIVSTEEGLSRVPSDLRQGSLALGATKIETLRKVVIPMASPAIMTGLILAVARAAGEVAPLMLVGVVKMAPSLPVDGNFPFIHLERKFMHLGFHIYDVGFQSPNVEAARPLVFATSLLLVSIIIGLNISAIKIRNHLREKYRALAH